MKFNWKRKKTGHAGGLDFGWRRVVFTCRVYPQLTHLSCRFI
jgi:hypothetical protein